MECAWNEYVTEDKAMQDCIQTECADLEADLVPKHAFKDGRTEVFHSLYTRNNSERLRYLTVTSLYSRVMTRKPLPVGQPKVHRKDFPDLKNFEGLYDCTVGPPASLTIPVVPYTRNGKPVWIMSRVFVRTQQRRMGATQGPTVFPQDFVHPRVEKSHIVWI